MKPLTNAIESTNIAIEEEAPQQRAEGAGLAGLEALGWLMKRLWPRAGKKGVIKRKDGSWLLLGPNGALS